MTRCFLKEEGIIVVEVSEHPPTQNKIGFRSEYRKCNKIGPKPESCRERIIDDIQMRTLPSNRHVVCISNSSVGVNLYCSPIRTQQYSVVDTLHMFGEALDCCTQYSDEISEDRRSTYSSTVVLELAVAIVACAGAQYNNNAAMMVTPGIRYS